MLSLTRLVALDHETTGPNMHADRIISIGAVAVTARTVRHDDAFEVVLRQERESGSDNILIHQIGGSGAARWRRSGEARLFLSSGTWTGRWPSRSARSSTRPCSRGELQACLGIRARVRFLDLACVLPALVPGTSNDSLDDWALHFGLPPIGRHHALADAYANAQLLLLALDHARRLGLDTTLDLLSLQKSQRWLGRRR